MAETTVRVPAANNGVAAGVSKGALWTGRVLSSLVVLFLAFDVAIKFVRPIPAQVMQTLEHIGWRPELMGVIGTILGICVVLYVIPQTAVLGAILLTGYLGGAVATHLRIGDPLFSHILFPTYLGVLLWLGLYLRDARLRGLVPFRR